MEGNLRSSEFKIARSKGETQMTKTALVTGSNKGIGYEIAKRLLEAGYRVLVGARDQERGRYGGSFTSSFW